MYNKQQTYELSRDPNVSGVDQLSSVTEQNLVLIIKSLEFLIAS